MSVFRGKLTTHDRTVWVIGAVGVLVVVWLCCWAAYAQSSPPASSPPASSPPASTPPDPLQMQITEVKARIALYERNIAQLSATEAANAGLLATDKVTLGQLESRLPKLAPGTAGAKR